MFMQQIDKFGKATGPKVGHLVRCLRSIEIGETFEFSKISTGETSDRILLGRALKIAVYIVPRAKNNFALRVYEVNGLVVTRIE